VEQKTVTLEKHSWVLGEAIGGGTFGTVFKGHSQDGTITQVAIKMIDKLPGAERELLFDFPDATNIIPVLDRGEDDGMWVIVMPLAELSLADYLEQLERPLDDSEVVTIMSDIATGLASLNGTVVHRDLKPDNVLYVDGTWQLTDFGISRYADATTAINTLKEWMTYQYAAPEQWKSQRAVPATDIYALGVIGYLLMEGRHPFEGPTVEDFQEQHLRGKVPDMSRGSARLRGMIVACMSKAPGARPSSRDIVQRLSRMQSSEDRPSFSALHDANYQAVTKAEEARREKEIAEKNEEERKLLYDQAHTDLETIRDELISVIEEAADATEVGGHSVGLRILRLNDATLTIEVPRDHFPDPPFTPDSDRLQVLAYTTIKLSIPRNYQGYRGRSHSLWFCNLTDRAAYAWYELAFMDSGTRYQGRQDEVPFAENPGRGAYDALNARLMSVLHPARRPYRLNIGDLESFVERWGKWFGEAASSRLQYPDSLPEEPWP